jgi:hypothetical protein
VARLEHAPNLHDRALEALRCLLDPVLSDESVEMSLPRGIDPGLMRFAAGGATHGTALELALGNLVPPLLVSCGPHLLGAAVNASKSSVNIE